MLRSMLCAALILLVGTQVHAQSAGYRVWPTRTGGQAAAYYKPGVGLAVGSRGPNRSGFTAVGAAGGIVHGVYNKNLGITHGFAAKPGAGFVRFGRRVR
jgi:hypothetical protein